MPGKKNEMNTWLHLLVVCLFTQVCTPYGFYFRSSEILTADTTSAYRVYPYYSVKRSELFPLQFLLGASTTTYHEIPCMKVPVSTTYVITRTRESDCDEEYEYA